MTHQDITALNPTVVTVQVGTRTLREIQIYPLSVGQQLEASEFIGELTAGLVSVADKDNAFWMGYVVDFLQNRLSGFLGMVTDEDEDPEKLIHEMTNNQAIEIARIIYEVNFAGLVKNFRGLLDGIRKLSPMPGPEQGVTGASGMPSHTASRNTPDTGSETSLSPDGTAASPSGSS